MRGNVAELFGVLEVVAELGGFGIVFFAIGHLGGDDAVGFDVFAQLAEQLGVFSEALHEDLAGAIKHGLGIGKAGVRVEEFGGLFFGHQRGVGQQCVGQRLQPGFAGDLGLGAALLLVRQVQVFEALFGFGVFDFGA